MNVSVLIEQPATGRVMAGESNLSPEPCPVAGMGAPGGGFVRVILRPGAPSSSGETRRAMRLSAASSYRRRWHLPPLVMSGLFAPSSPAVIISGLIPLSWPEVSRVSGCEVVAGRSWPLVCAVAPRWLNSFPSPIGLPRQPPRHASEQKD